MNKKILASTLVCALFTSSAFAGISDVDQFLSDYENTPLIEQPMLYDSVESIMPISETPDDIVTIMETPTIETTSIKDTTSNTNILSGTYLGNGFVLINGKKILIVSRHLEHLSKNDQVTLDITGTIDSFTINSISKNGILLETSSLIVSNSTTELLTEGKLTLSGTYLGDNKLNSNGKIITIYSRYLKDIPPNTKIQVQIEGTLKKFKIKKITTK